MGARSCGPSRPACPLFLDFAFAFHVPTFLHNIFFCVPRAPAFLFCVPLLPLQLTHKVLSGAQLLVKMRYMRGGGEASPVASWLVPNAALWGSYHIYCTPLTTKNPRLQTRHSKLTSPISPLQTCHSTLTMTKSLHQARGEGER